MFEKLIATIDSSIARKIFRVHLSDAPNAPVIVNPQAVQNRHDTVTVGSAVKQQTFTGKKNTPSSTKGSISDLAAALASAKDTDDKPEPGVAAPKIGRNDPCPCGSGKKYKKCHGKNL